MLPLRVFTESSKTFLAGTFIIKFPHAIVFVFDNSTMNFQTENNIIWKSSYIVFFILKLYLFVFMFFVHSSNSWWSAMYSWRNRLIRSVSKHLRNKGKIKRKYFLVWFFSRYPRLIRTRNYCQLCFILRKTWGYYVLNVIFRGIIMIAIP